MPAGFIGIVMVALAILLIVFLVLAFVSRPQMTYFLAAALICLAILVLLLVFTRGSATAGALTSVAATAMVVRAAYMLG